MHLVAITYDATAVLELVDRALADFAALNLVEQSDVQDRLLDIRLAAVGQGV